jgi:hypothetical protein
MLYELIPNMPQRRLTPLIDKFAEAVSRAGLFPTALRDAQMRGYLSVVPRELWGWPAARCKGRLDWLGLATTSLKERVTIRERRIAVRSRRLRCRARLQ